MEFFAILAAVAAAAIAFFVVKKVKTGSVGGFKVCWAGANWRSCYGKNVKLENVGPTTVTVVMDEPNREPHYLVKQHGDITRKDFLVVSYRVNVLSGDPFFYAVDTKGTDTPAIVSAFFQREGDDMYAKGNMQYYRWWSVETLKLTPGVHTLRVPLAANQGKWTSVYGGKSDARVNDFEQAKRYCRQIGLTFGGGGGRGHGIRVKNGMATIQVIGAWTE